MARINFCSSAAAILCGSFGIETTQDRDANIRRNDDRGSLAIGRAILPIAAERRPILRAAPADKARCQPSKLECVSRRRKSSRTRNRRFAIAARSGGFASAIKYIDQVMRNAATLCQRRLRRADVESLIKLRRIARDNFAADSFGKPNAERGFTGSRRTQNHDQRRERFVVGH